MNAGTLTRTREPEMWRRRSLRQPTTPDRCISRRRNIMRALRQLELGEIRDSETESSSKASRAIRLLRPADHETAAARDPVAGRNFPSLARQLMRRCVGEDG